MTTLDSRIYRADQRMVQAKCAKWCRLWRRMFYRLVDRRNAMAMVRAVRSPPANRDLASGAASVAYRGVTTSGKHPTTDVVGLQMEGAE
jgi:hypothetical protein